MRSLLLLTLLIALAGCAEAAHGPRIVPYTEDRFYIRHVPVLDWRGDVDLLAGRVCEQVGKEAIFEEADQFVWLDVRYSTYRCGRLNSAEVTDRLQPPG
jgi:hypothetical protein